jgi:hypothetical protein
MASCILDPSINEPPMDEMETHVCGRAVRGRSCYVCVRRIRACFRGGIEGWAFCDGVQLLVYVFHVGGTGSWEHCLGMLLGLSTRSVCSVWLLDDATTRHICILKFISLSSAGETRQEEEKKGIEDYLCSYQVPVFSSFHLGLDVL